MTVLGIVEDKRATACVRGSNVMEDRMAAQSGFWLTRRLRPIWRRLQHYVVHEWPTFIFVASMVTVVDHDLHSFNLINSYAYAVASVCVNFITKALKPTQDVYDPNQPLPQKNDKSDFRAAVVLIDEKTHQSRYLDRSPLSRCKLHADLAKIYAKHPNLVAIDLDISPALWLMPKNELLEKWLNDPPDPAATEDGPNTENLPYNEENEAACQLLLYRLILKNSRDVKTVLMQPDPVLDERMQENISSWKEKMQKNAVLFGSADIPIDYGVVVALDRTSIAGIVIGTAGNKEKKPGEMPSLINPAMYRALPVHRISEIEADDESIKNHGPDLFGKTVFFGGGWGREDTFITPVGEIYGVEVHAASYLSYVNPIKKQGTYAFDIVFSIITGAMLSRMWRRYFFLRSSHYPIRREYATVYLFKLLIKVALLLLASLAFSFVLLNYINIWLTPVPIIASMMVDSLFLAPVTHSDSRISHCDQPSKNDALLPKGFLKKLQHSVKKFFYHQIIDMRNASETLASARKKALSAAPMNMAQPTRKSDFQRSARCMVVRRCLWVFVVGLACLEFF